MYLEVKRIPIRLFIQTYTNCSGIRLQWCYNMTPLIYFLCLAKPVIKSHSYFYTFTRLYFLIIFCFHPDVKVNNNRFWKFKCNFRRVFAPLLSSLVFQTTWENAFMVIICYYCLSLLPALFSFFPSLEYENNNKSLQIEQGTIFKVPKKHHFKQVLTFVVIETMTCFIYTLDSPFSSSFKFWSTEGPRLTRILKQRKKHVTWNSC